MTTETQVAAAWLYDTLSNDSEVTDLVDTRIYQDVAPQGSTTPYIVYQASGQANDLMVVGQIRVWSDGLWTVKVVDQSNSYASADAVYTKVDLALHRGDGTATGGIVHTATREQTFSYPEIDQGVHYKHIGGVYRIQVSQ